jgi:hypothetical protein
MAIYSFFIINKSAGMVYAKDYATYVNENDKVFTYPLDIKLDKYGSVRFGARDPIKIGHNLLAINGKPVYLDKVDQNKLKMDDLKGADDVLEYLEKSDNFPCTLKFGKSPLSINDKLVLTGRFFGYLIITCSYII